MEWTGAAKRAAAAGGMAEIRVAAGAAKMAGAQRAERSAVDRVGPAADPSGAAHRAAVEGARRAEGLAAREAGGERGRSRPRRRSRPVPPCDYGPRC